MRRTVHSLAEALAERPIVVNCTGLGARSLLGDKTLFPIRGQIIRVEPLLLDYFYLDEGADGDLTYIVPRSKDCILGGTDEPHNWSLEPDPATAAAIMERCARLVPALRDTHILEHRVGLRPGRPTVRLEANPQLGGQLIVHNYGHGGAGVTLSWGCADEVVAHVMFH